MFLRFPPRTFKAQEVGKLATRSYEANHKMQKAQEVSSWLALILLVQRADHGLCFPKQIVSKRKGYNVIFLLGKHLMVMGSELYVWPYPVCHTPCLRYSLKEREVSMNVSKHYFQEKKSINHGINNHQVGSEA